MKRRKFLRNFITGGVALGVSPNILALAENEIVKPSKEKIEEQMLSVLFNDTPIKSFSNLFINLYNKDGELASYEGYKPAEIPRTFEYWDVTEDSIVNKKEISFPQCNGRSEMICSFSIDSKNKEMFFKGDLSTVCHVSSGTTLQFSPRALDIKLE